MNQIAQSLVALTIDVPLLGAVVGLLMLLRRGRWLQRGETAALLGIVIGSVAAFGLAAILYLDPTGTCVVSTSFGAWGAWNGLSVAFGLHADLNSSVWVGTLSGLSAGIAWHSSCIARQRQTKPETSTALFTIHLSLLFVISAGITLSSSLLQMTVCWMLLSPVTMALVGSTSSLSSAATGMQRVIQIGLIGDLLLLWGVMLIELTTGTDSLVHSFSAMGLQRLGTDPALPGLIGTILVLSLIGRCGLFPAFGWHIGASHWKGELSAVIYGIGLIPSATWVAIKCQPLIASSELPLLLLGVIGSLGAVLGMFVSCQQSDPCHRLAWLLSSQCGVIFAGLGSGQPAAVATAIWYQCSLSIASVVLFLSLDQAEAKQTGSKPRLPLRVIAVACAAFSMAGFFPGAGAWTQRVLMELNMQPISWEIVEDSEEEAQKTESKENSVVVTPQPGKPNWGWIGGLWLVQGLTAFSITQIFHAATRNNALGICRPFVIETIALLLVMMAPCPWLLGVIPIPDTTGQLVRFAISQAIIVAGLFIGSRLINQQSGSRDSNRITMSSGEIAVKSPLEWIERAFLTNWFEQVIARTAGRALSWVGSLTELLHVEHVEFLLVIPLVGTSVLLLTLFLIGK
ncbi:MAG: proton-conducting transporter membrane subunit [Planctomycetaceae bacterium]